MKVRVYMHPLSPPALLRAFLTRLPKEAREAEAERRDDARVPIGIAVVITDGDGEAEDGDATPDV